MEGVVKLIGRSYGRGGAVMVVVGEREDGGGCLIAEYRWKWNMIECSNITTSRVFLFLLKTKSLQAPPFSLPVNLPFLLHASDWENCAQPLFIFSLLLCCRSAIPSLLRWMSDNANIAQIHFFFFFLFKAAWNTSPVCIYTSPDPGFTFE